MKSLANDRGGPLECDFGIDRDGLAYWRCKDAGEGDSVDLWIEKMEVKPEGCEPGEERLDFSEEYLRRYIWRRRRVS